MLKMVAQSTVAFSLSTGCPGFFETDLSLCRTRQQPTLRPEIGRRNARSAAGWSSQRASSRGPGSCLRREGLGFLAKGLEVLAKGLGVLAKGPERTGVTLCLLVQCLFLFGLACL